MRLYSDHGKDSAAQRTITITPITCTSEITVKLIQSMGGDHMMAAAAKVSVSPEDALELSQTEAKEGISGLILYLMKHRHGTPFEHSAMTFVVHAPIFVWREWHRHRIGFCLSGDTVITLGKWSQSRTIAEIHRNWHEGVPDSRPFKVGQGVAFDSQTGKWRVQARRNGKTISLGRYTDKTEAIAVRSQWEEENPTFRVRKLPSCCNLRARVLDEKTNIFTTGRMSNVFESGIKELFSVRTVNGHELMASRDHCILTIDGWAKVDQLRKGDRIAVVGKRSKFAERQIPPSLRQGIGVWTSMQRSRLIREEDYCYICGCHFMREALVLDHIVPVVTDLLRALDVNNLKPACEACHRIKTNGEQMLAQRANVAGSKFAPLSQTPERVSENMTYDIEMDGPHHNFVANKIVVHNSYNEESGRYTQLKPVFYLPPDDRPMFKMDGWKPGRPKFLPINGETGKAAYAKLCSNLKEVYQHAYDKYEENLGLGIDPGLARDCLPVGIYSSCWVTVNPRSLMAFLSLRTHQPDAKFVSYPLYEIEVAARACEKIFAEGWPITYSAFVANGRVAP